MKRQPIRLAGRRFEVVLLNLAAPGKNQDSWLIREDFVAVADGATPLGDHGDYGEVREFANAALESLAANSRVLAAREMFSAAIRAIGQTRHVSWQTPSCSVAVLREHEGAAEIDLLGDCLAVVQLDHDEPVVIRDERLPAMDGGVIDELRAQLQAGKTVEDALAGVQPLLRVNRGQMNSDDGYWTFASNPAAAYEVLTNRLDPAEIEAVLLCTDGFYRLWDTLQLMAAPDDLLTRSLKDGLPELGKILRTAESSPNSMRDHPRFTRYDDATAMLVVAEGVSA